MERVENSLWLFEFSTLSTGRHFHGALHLVVLGAKRRRAVRPLPPGFSRPSPAFFSFSAKIRTFLIEILRQDRPGTTILRSLDRSTSLFAQAFLPPRSLRIDSPCISMRWALCTSRSRMLSAKVGSPICSCHLATGNWLVKMVERV